MPIKTKHPIPDDWDGETWKDICILWPDSPLWRGILRGFLSTPRRGRFWDEHTGNVRDTQEIGKTIYEANEAMDPCDGVICPPGPMGPTGPPGQDCDCGISTGAEKPPGVTNRQANCGIAQYIVAELEAWFFNAMNLIDEYTELHDYLSDALSIIPVWGPVLAIGWQGLVNLFGINTTVARAQADPLYWSDMLCHIYLYLSDSEPGFGAGARDSLVSFVESYPDTEEFREYWADFLQGLPIHTWTYWATIGVFDASDQCGAVCGWCHEFDFSGGDQQGWTAETGSFDVDRFVAGDGVDPLNALYLSRSVRLLREFDLSTITRVEVTLNRTEGSVWAGPGARIMSVSGDDWPDMVLKMAMDDEEWEGEGLVFEWIGYEEINQLWYFCRALLGLISESPPPPPYDGLVEVIKIIVCGLGTNPFV